MHIICCYTTGNNYIKDNTLQAFSGRIVYPTSSTYDQDRISFNKKIDAKPAIIFFCNDSEDIKIAINYAKSVRKPIRVRSNRHSYEGFSIADDAVVIDISGITTIELNHDKTTVKVGAGNDLYNVYKKLWEEHLTIPGGSCPTVGIAGFTLGGGIGFSSRLMGLAADNVVAFELITANAQFLTINEQQYSDLFWACRGAGNGNFGVIVSLTFKTHQVNNNLSIYKIEWDWDQLYHISNSWFRIRETAPDTLMMFLRFQKQEGQKSIFSFGQYFGSMIELKKILEPLLQFPAKNILVKELNYMEAVDFWAGIPHRIHATSYREDSNKQRQAFKATSLYLRQPFSRQALEVIDKYYTQNDIKNNYTIIDSYGGQINKVAENFNAFPHRGTIASVQILAYWQNDIEKNVQLEWSRRYYCALEQFGEGGAYSNYPDIWLKDWATKYYGNNLHRLKQIKRKYDPHNLFHYEQSIPVE
ncbi:FAD-binding oxidoreductase [Candidatus Cardinium hertigii]|uniref:FAD-binding oxidoreductase n=1 Tax=Candidatus Cardinium hertigii TaxID=247481 RepID=UPI001614C251|nr:FAD-binding oxidoreductase [Candidatus Cardinium hertigii]